jgi:hypothetical protein
MVRNHEVEKVVTVFGAYNFHEFDLAKAIHEMDPTIPVLIFGSHAPDEKIPNEYFTNEVGFFEQTVNEFLEGILTEEDYRLFPKVKTFF